MNEDRDLFLAAIFMLIGYLLASIVIFVIQLLGRKAKRK